MFCVSLKGSSAGDDYQPGGLRSCFLSADVAPVIQLADLMSDCRAKSFLVGQLGSAAAQHRHPVEKQQVGRMRMLQQLLTASWRSLGPILSASCLI